MHHIYISATGDDDFKIDVFINDKNSLNLGNILGSFSKSKSFNVVSYEKLNLLFAFSVYSFL